MQEFHLYIANKNYSSWSFRAWMGLKHLGLNFKEHIIPLGMNDTKETIQHVSPSGMLPCLHVGSLVVWDSFAILEYAHDRFPKNRLLPLMPELRAMARSACLEMHSGFTALRKECPMNMKRRKSKEMSDEATRDLNRIYHLWDYIKQPKKTHHDSFLLGDFSIVDAYFAPIVSRVISYGLDKGKHTDYIDLISNLNSYKEWEIAAMNEKWVIDKYE